MISDIKDDLTTEIDEYQGYDGMNKQGFYDKQTLLEKLSEYLVWAFKSALIENDSFKYGKQFCDEIFETIYRNVKRGLYADAEEDEMENDKQKKVYATVFFVFKFWSFFKISKDTLKKY